jgi:hypothetical protein
VSGADRVTQARFALAKVVHYRLDATFDLHTMVRKFNQKGLPAATVPGFRAYLSSTPCFGQKRSALVARSRALKVGTAESAGGLGSDC